MSGFSPQIRAACTRLHGVDPEQSLREWLWRLTGKTGAALNDLIDAGAEEGRRTEQQESFRVEPGTRLTDAEVRALSAVCDQGSVKDAAAALGVSEWTVHHQLKFARLRLGVHTTAQAVRLAIRTGQMAA